MSGMNAAQTAAADQAFAALRDSALQVAEDMAGKLALNGGDLQRTFIEHMPGALLHSAETTVQTAVLGELMLALLLAEAKRKGTWE